MNGVARLDDERDLAEMPGLAEAEVDLPRVGLRSTELPVGFLDRVRDERVQRPVASIIEQERVVIRILKPDMPGFPSKNRADIEARELGWICDRRLKICLLYTSPSPRDLSTSRMPSSA